MGQRTGRGRLDQPVAGLSPARGGTTRAGAGRRVGSRRGEGIVVGRSALVFAAGAVGLWSTNALVGKSLLASHPVSLVQFLQFSGAALVFAVIRLMSRETATPENAALAGPITASAALVPIGVGIVGLVGTMVLQYIAFAAMPVIEANLVAYTWPLMVAAAVIVLENPQRPVLL